MQPRSLDFVKEGKNVIVLRTFSKLYGMAGIRMGFAIGRPDLLEKLDYFGDELAAHHGARRRQGQPARRRPGLHAQEDHRRHARGKPRLAARARATLSRHRRATASCSTPRRPGKEVMAAMAAKDIYIGRIWPAWPTQVRITVGTHDEMMAFQKAFSEVMSISTAGLTMPERRANIMERPFEA